MTTSAAGTTGTSGTSTSYLIPGIRVTDHAVPVPLDWRADAAGHTGGETITLFARELVDPVRQREDLPVLVYLQGGPGGKGPRPTGPDGWIGEALKSYRVLLLDQRGTGRSTRIEGGILRARGTAEQQAAYLSMFRADSIVKDAEHLRQTLYGGRRWQTLGQSYGGFLTLTYLSQAPQGLSASHVTGGLASIRPDAREVYRRTYPRVVAKNAEFYERYPHDVDRIARIADRLSSGDVRLPDGDVLTVRRFQSLGIDFGMKPGYERMHWLVDEALDDRTETGLTETFLAQVLARSSYDDNPLFAALQESIYGQASSGATGWAAQAERDTRPEFAETARPLTFTGEMMYPWMFDEIRALRPFADAVNLLAERTDWEPLYDLDRLAANEVPLAAAVYYDDMYVDAGLQLETVAHVGNAHAWVTNEYEHDGIGSPRVFPRLRQMIAERGGALAEEATSETMARVVGKVTVTDAAEPAAAATSTAAATTAAATTATATNEETR